MSLNAAAEQNEFTYYWCKKQCCEHTKWLLVLFVLSREWFILHSLWIWASIFSPSWPDLFACDITIVCSKTEIIAHIILASVLLDLNLKMSTTNKTLTQFRFSIRTCIFVAWKTGLLFKSCFPIISCSMMEESFRKMFPSNIFYV